MTPPYSVHTVITVLALDADRHAVELRKRRGGGEELQAEFAKLKSLLW